MRTSRQQVGDQQDWGRGGIAGKPENGGRAGKMRSVTHGGGATHSERGGRAETGRFWREQLGSGAVAAAQAGCCARGGGGLKTNHVPSRRSVAAGNRAPQSQPGQGSSWHWVSPKCEARALPTPCIFADHHRVPRAVLMPAPRARQRPAAAGGGLGGQGGKHGGCSGSRRALTSPGGVESGADAAGVSWRLCAAGLECWVHTNTRL